MVSSAVPVLLRGIRSLKKFFFRLFIFIFHDSKRQVKEKLAAFYVKVCSAFSLKSFILSVRWVFNLFVVFFVYAVREYSNLILIS